MSNERLAEIKDDISRANTMYYGIKLKAAIAEELWEALEAERNYVRDLTSGIVVDGWIETETRLRKRIKELEAKTPSDWLLENTLLKEKYTALVIGLLSKIDLFEKRRNTATHAISKSLWHIASHELYDLIEDKE
jgi:hypothetical protein